LTKWLILKGLIKGSEFSLVFQNQIPSQVPGRFLNTSAGTTSALNTSRILDSWLLRTVL
jgi:hypothetical protein